ncbi:Nuclear transport factor 2 [Gnomoniopsis smithogilvyi]|uniref:Nuclear transport factor 2 n=1 Tax=Gnomoniopsis smithogilvyi TaxID=1191159 RepID=A0A9W8YW76_9PEZI|nr:Nuclear transport factor 2 [Gnomoniopsis smithogilvyi]
MAANFQEVASQFVPFYYNTFDTNREGLASLYRDTSMLTYESASVMGVAAIVDKLTNLSFQNVKHETNTIDPMPGFGDSGVLIQVTGFIIVDGDEAQPFKFAQTFHLVQEPGTGSFYVSHDIFKLIF